MAIYVFSLLVGYYHGGIDYAQGTRYKYLQKLSQPVKYVYTSIPTEEYVRRYRESGIKMEDMISAHFLLCGRGDIGEATHISEKSYYSKGQLVIQEHYSDRLLYTDYYTSVQHNGASVTKLVKKTFRKQDGTVAYDIIFDENGNERYLFPNGENLSKYEFLCKFVQQLNLTKKDIVLIDRAGNSDFVQPLFAYGNKAKINVFFHSWHYAEKGESSEFLYLNYVYYYWFRNSHLLHTMIVSTDEQKNDLIGKLREYGCHVPNIEVIPASGLDTLRCSSIERKPYSLLTASRFVPVKKIEWIIRSVIEAHKVCEEITLDIYGRGQEKYTAALMQLVETNHAESYIHFMGHCDMKERYMGYETYISTSLGETLGLTLMEAAGSGNALIGLNVKYGNKIFIQDGENGYLTDIDIKKIGNEQYVDGLIKSMAEDIINIFSDQVRLKTFQEKSYQIAENYLENVIEEKWIRFFENSIAED